MFPTGCQGGHGPAAYRHTPLPRVCGRALPEPAAMGGELEAVPLAAGATINPLTVGTPTVALRVAMNCDHGADVLITPTGVARVADAVRARDGKLVAITLVGVGPGTATLTVRESGRVIAAIGLIVPQPPMVGAGSAAGG